MRLSTAEKRCIRLAFEDLRADLKADHLFYSASVYSKEYNECYQARADMLSIALDKLEIWREKPEGYLIRGMCKVMVMLQHLRDDYGESINRWHIPDEHREHYCHSQLHAIILKIEDKVSYLGCVLGNNWR